MSPFNTVLQEWVTEVVVEKSRFIAHLAPAVAEAEGVAFLEKVRKQYWDATHHVPAWRIRPSIQKFSDDGEPSGTAGLPVLDALKHSEMENAALVVVRYFGGVKLGTGGLVRAYGMAAKAVLEASELYRVERYDTVRVSTDYSNLGRLQSYLTEIGVLEAASSFEDIVRLTFHCQRKDTEAIMGRIVDMTSGSVVPERMDPLLLAVRGKSWVHYDMGGA